jgi:2'-5' RNA ligase
MTRVRTFIGVDPGKAVRERMVALQTTLARTGSQVKWVEPDNLHVTLLFLGEVDDRRLPEVCRLVGECTQSHSAFDMTVEGVGCFPNLRRPRILWVGVGKGEPGLSALHDDLEVPLLELGYRREERRYTPHITLGRVRSEHSTDRLSAELRQLASWQAGEHFVREVQVMGSELTPKGPVYTILGRGKLSQKPQVEAVDP